MSDSADPLASFEAMDQAADSGSTSDLPVDDPVVPCQKNKKRRLRIVLRDVDFSLLTNKDYELTVAGVAKRANTGPEGIIDELIPENTTEAELAVWMDDDPESGPVVWDLTVTDLDPISMESGAETRLDNLAVGWDPGDSKARSEMEDFQAAVDVSASGELDSATRAKLSDVYSTKPLSNTARVWKPPEGK